jgi:hypothetical protein
MSQVANKKPTFTMSGGDDKSMNLTSSGSMSSGPGLTTNKLKQWDRKNSEQRQHQLHQQFSSSVSPSSGSGTSPTQQQQQQKQQQQQQFSNPQPQPQRVYTMSSALPSQQQMNALNDGNQSESDASSFNLSTDAEDSEYETMKRSSMHYPPANLNNLGAGLTALDTSAIDTVGSITSYTTDEDRKIFPNLPTDDEMTLGTDASSKTGQPMPPSLLLQPLPNPMQVSQVTVPLKERNKNSTAVETKHTPMASNAVANHASVNTSVNTSTNTSVNTSNDSSFVKINNNPHKSLDPSWTNFAVDPANQPTSTKSSKSISRNRPGGTPRNFTSPKSTTSSNTDFSNDGFGAVRTGSAGKKSASKSSNDGFNKKPQTKNFATPNDGFADFGDFADFGNFPSTADIDKDGAQWATVKEEKKDADQSSWENHNKNFFGNTSGSKSSKPNTSTSFGNDIDDPAWNVNVNIPSPNTKSNDNNKDDPFAASAVGSGSYVSSGTSSGFQSGTSSGFQASTNDSSLTELLEAAKSKRNHRRTYSSGNRHSSRLSTSSVNSAPAITAAYLRQHHNLGGKNQTGGDDPHFDAGPSMGNSYGGNQFTGDSVSDIIHNLEATDRVKRAEQITSYHSMGDAGVVATARAAKERLRERRRQRESAAGATGRNYDQSYSDEEEEGGKNSESWLFDQVTGAIGPAGIAADLESLSGRSNKSKNSYGGKSHGNRRRSSRKTGSRRHRSDRSVDSHGSRASKYSHRSTKSFLSQMSEQSRSVANDLLRLEMQLAMVGNAKDADGLPIASSAAARLSSGASTGGGSRTSMRSSGRKSSGGMGSRHAASSSSSVVRRSKATIVAPPGKLGIILANRSDSKGTVVSGVRTSSVLVDRISPGDRIVAIDGEDVSQMTVSEITTIMSRKAEYERRLTILTATAAAIAPARTGLEMRSPNSFSSPKAGDYGRDLNSFSSPKAAEYGRRYGE